MPTHDELPSVTAALPFLAPDVETPVVRVYTPSSGRESVPTRLERVPVRVHDARPIAASLDLDVHGFALLERPSATADFGDDDAIRARYYPEVAQLVKERLGALEVVVFDHNVRSAARAARREPGIQAPVDQVHNDYSDRSGPKRKRDILVAAGRADLLDRDVAFVNLWRPIVGPIVDNPLAVCDASSVGPGDLVDTDILHFADDDPEVPRHHGHVQSVRHSAGQRWFYVSRMMPSEFLLLKCYDSRRDGRARFMPHTGFEHPDRPEGFTPRESIEARTLVVF